MLRSGNRERRRHAGVGRVPARRVPRVRESRARPVYEGTRRDVREFGLYKVAGLAADAVASVQFFRPNGAVALTVPVSANVYVTTDVPKGPVAGLAAIDKSGKRLWRSP